MSTRDPLTNARQIEANRRSRRRKRGEDVPKRPRGRPPKGLAQVTWHGKLGGPVDLFEAAIEDDPNLPPVVRMARAFTHSSLAQYVRGLASKDEEVAMRAADRLLERGWGKAPQLVMQAPAVQSMSREELDARIGEALLRLRDRMDQVRRAQEAGVVAVQHGAEVAKDCPSAQVTDPAGKPDAPT